MNLNLFVVFITLPIIVETKSMDPEGNVFFTTNDCLKNSDQVSVCHCLQQLNETSYLRGDLCQFGRKRYLQPFDNILTFGKYYINETKHTYLVDSMINGTPIQFTFNKFALECNWDHVYIYDGRSVNSPLLAAFSGVMVHKKAASSSLDRKVTVTAHSGAALLHFYSDRRVNEEGYNISYMISSCNTCSNHGVCLLNSTQCKCDAGWMGTNCSQPVCCMEKFDLLTGTESCAQCSKNSPVGFEPRASHASAVIDKNIYILGGYSFSHHNLTTLIKYNTETHAITEYDALTRRHDHTMIAYGDKLIVYGGWVDGVATNDLLQYESPTNSWSVIKTSRDARLPTAGHAAVVVHQKMYVFFGFNHESSLLPQVQIFSIDVRKWSVMGLLNRMQTRIPVPGRYGHSATYDEKTLTVLIYGGFERLGKVTTDLLIYDVTQHRWSYGKSLGQASMLHAAFLWGRNLVVLGGNANSNYHDSAKQRCYSKAVFVYSIDCNSWHSSKVELHSKGRYGHTVEVVNKSIYVIGGFSGYFHGNIFQAQVIGDCSSFGEESSCLAAPALAGCVWNYRDKKCIEETPLLPETSFHRPLCTPYEKGYCTTAEACQPCIGKGCYWDAGKCSDPGGMIVALNVGLFNRNNKCFESLECNYASTCKTCDCEWRKSKKLCVPFAKKDTENSHDNKCSNKTHCGQYNTCEQCTFGRGTGDKSCVWCESLKQCAESNLYTMLYPYGQCRSWVSQGQCHEVRCSQQPTCDKCFRLPQCGWCDDGSGTGTGTCMDGSDLAPDKNSTCPANNWFFTECPACQCNGHSTCGNTTDVCQQCFNNVGGQHCERCKFGYYGNPEDNGTCVACDCNGHTRECKSDGTCLCNLRGSMGNHCEMCDTKDKYTGNSTDGGICYYRLEVNFRYTTNVTQHKLAAFDFIPKGDKDVKFKIERISGEIGLMNFSILYTDGRRKDFVANHPLGAYKRILSKEDLGGGARMVIYLVQPDWIKFIITFNHPSEDFNLVYFLIMFMVCFCSLVIVLIILWKVKQRYEAYTRNRQQQRELEQRISRPFKTTTLVFQPDPTKYIPVKASSCYVALEPLASRHLGVASVVIEYPRSDTPTGESAICIGSTLTTLPHRWTLANINPKKKRNAIV